MDSLVTNPISLQIRCITNRSTRPRGSYVKALMTNRILIVRLSAIGDCILSVPVLNSIRRNFPIARVGWVIEKASSQLIQGHSALDDLFVISKQTFKSPRQLWKLAGQLRAWKPDVTLDLQGLTKSSILAWLSGAKSRLGFHRDEFDGRELSRFLNNRLYAPESEHIVDRSLELLKLLGVEDPAAEFNLPEQEKDAAFAERVQKLSSLEGRFAIINVGAGWTSKLWPMERYASVVKHLSEYWGLPCLVVWSGEQENLVAKQIVSACQRHAVLSPPTTLLQLASLIRRASLFVGSDTGPMHLSVAVGTPTVGIIGPMPIERVCPYGPRSRGVQRTRLTKGSDRKKDCAPMLSIDSDSVIQACDQLMSGSKFNRLAS